MLASRGDDRILCADSSGERLGELTRRLRSEGFHVVCTRSAAECLAITAEFRPNIIVLDTEFLEVDLENIPEYISRIHAATSVFLTVEDPSVWRNKPPQYVDAVVKRGDLDSLVSLARRIR